ncbi:MAG: hypothetical protein HC913_01745 [Microscillaceae bacterium]|nr:hypothetical protein [Microscillaceae bacterium]
MNHKNLLIVLMSLVFGLASCGFDRYNAVTADTEDLRENDERVYGDGPEAPARQLKNEYPEPEDGKKRAATIKERFLGLDKATPSTTDSTVAPADSSQVAPVDTTQAKGA